MAVDHSLHGRRVRPFRHTEFHLQTARLLHGERQCGAVAFGKIRHLLHLRLAPCQHRGNEQVHVKFVVSLMRIDHFAVTCMVFHSRTYTTPEAGLRLPVMSRPHGCEINESPLHGIYRGKDMVIKRPFVEIHVMHIRTRLVQHFGQA